MGLGEQYWVHENSLSKSMCNKDLDGDGIYDHFSFTLRNNCLHSIHPLGWFRDFKLYLDEEEIPQDKSYFVLRGQLIPLKQLPTITDIWWEIIENAEIYGYYPGGVPAGIHQVKCEMDTSLVPNTRTVDTKEVWRRLPIVVEGQMCVEIDGEGTS